MKFADHDPDKLSAHILTNSALLFIGEMDKDLQTNIHEALALARRQGAEEMRRQAAEFVGAQNYFAPMNEIAAQIGRLPLPGDKAAKVSSETDR